MELDGRKVFVFVYLAILHDTSLFFTDIFAVVMIHGCIYQFLRIFYHSRFKPQQLKMTAAQLLAPVSF